MHVDTWVQNGRVIGPAGIALQDVLIRDGRIVALTEPKNATIQADTVIDATGLFVLPGIIDSHAHFNEPGKDDREDFASGSRAAAKGGITTYIEMPNSLPPCYNVDILDERIALAEAKSVVDFAFYGAAGSDNLVEIPRLASAGVVGFKTFMTDPPPERRAEFWGLSASRSDAVLDVFTAVERTGLVSAVHAEDGVLIRRLTEQLRSQGRTDALAWAESRPEAVELIATATAIELARYTGCRVQLCHVSSPTAVEMASGARASGVSLTVESCPHYLYFSMSDLERMGPYAKIAPPLRSAHHVELLWELLLQGDIDMLGSDHAPYVLQEKEAGWEDIFQAASGIAAIELLLPLMLHAVHQGRLDLVTVVRLLSEAPARIFGLYPRKGALRVGSDADMVLLDMEKSQQVCSENLLSRGRAAARLLDGMQLHGVPMRTMVRGKTVMVDGNVQPVEGWGRMQRP